MPPDDYIFDCAIAHTFTLLGKSRLLLEDPRTIHTSFSRGAWGNCMTLREYSSDMREAITEDEVSKSSAFWFQRRRFLNVFTIYGHGGHLSHVT